MEIKVMCKFEATFEVPDHIEYGTSEFEEFVEECIGSEDMLTQAVTDSGLVSINKNGYWKDAQDDDWIKNKTTAGTVAY